MKISANSKAAGSNGQYGHAASRNGAALPRGRS
jgi:hypothetical protein